SGPTSRGRTSTASTGSSTASATSPRSSRTGCSGRTTRRRSAPMLDELDDRRLLVELQSLGVRVVEEDADAAPTRRGGAGPSDALFLWVRGLPLTVPAHADFVDASPYTLRTTGRNAQLFRDDEFVAPVTVPRRPKIYDMETAAGVP